MLNRRRLIKRGNILFGQLSGHQCQGFLWSMLAIDCLGCCRSWHHLLPELSGLISRVEKVEVMGRSRLWMGREVELVEGVNDGDMELPYSPVIS